MNAQQTQRIQYGFSKTIDVPFDAALEKTRAELKNQGFGVISEVDLQDKLKEKLGVSFRRYMILGACNPPLAYKTLQEELAIGLLLPCNVIVYEADEENKTVVAAIDARAMFTLVPNKPALSAVANEVHERLQAVITKL